MSHGGDQQTTKEVSTEMFHVTSNACPQSTGISSLEKKNIKDSKFENILLYLQKDSISLQITASLKMMKAFKLFSAALRRSQEIWGKGGRNMNILLVHPFAWLTCQVWGLCVQCRSCEGTLKPRQSQQNTSWPCPQAEVHRYSSTDWHNLHLKKHKWGHHEKCFQVRWLRLKGVPCMVDI